MRSGVAGEIEYPNESPGRQNAAGTVLRDLGALEHLFWLLDQTRPVHFAMTAHIRGVVELHEWRAALDKVQRRHPLLSVRIEGKPGSRPHFASDDGLQIPLRIVTGKSEASWEAEAVKELSNPFVATEAPLARAVLIQKPKETFFMLLAHHAIADGLALSYVIRDVLQALNGVSLESAPLLPSQDEAIRALKDIVAIDSHAETPLGRPAVYPAADAERYVRSLRLSPEFTAKLRARSKNEGTTVHGILCAAAAICGGTSGRGWQPVRILSPIETCTTLAADDQYAVYMTSVIAELLPNGVNVWDMARTASRSARAAKTPESMAQSIAAMQQFVVPGLSASAAADASVVAFAREMMLSNIGVVPFDTVFGKLKIEALWGPAVISGVDTVGVATSNESICLTHTSHVPESNFLSALHQTLEFALARTSTTLADLS